MSEQDPKTITRRRLLLTAGAAAGSTAILASTLPFRSAFAAAPPQVKVGMFAPYTGSAAEFGAFYEAGVQLAVDQVNKAAEKILGGPIIKQLLAVDTGTLPAPGIAAVKKLIQAHRVPVVIGGWSSGVTVAVATSATLPAGVLQVGYGATSPLITVLPKDRTRDLLFRTTASDALQGRVAALLAAGEIVPNYKHKTAATVYINNPYGQGLSSAFARTFRQQGGIIHAQVPHPEKIQPTYKSELAYALKDKPDLLFIPSYPSHTSVLLNESRDVFGFTKWQLSDGNKSSQVIEAVGANSLQGVLGTAPGEDVNAPAYRGFKKNYGKDRIPPFTNSAYDAGAIVALAIAKAVIDGDISDPDAVTGRVIRDQLRAVANPPGADIAIGSQESINHALEMIKQGRDINITGAAGPDDFDEHGDVVTPYGIWQVKGKGFETIKLWPVEKIPEA